MSNKRVEALARWFYVQDLLREFPHLNDNTLRSTMLVETDYNILKDQWQYLARRLIDSGVLEKIDTKTIEDIGQEDYTIADTMQAQAHNRAVDKLIEGKR